MTKIGIFGGSFNPVHMGHVQSIVDVANKCELEKVIVVPAYQNPLKSPIDGPNPEQRLEMLNIAFDEYSDLVSISDIELQRKGKSYTVDTIAEFAKDYKPEQLHLILGIDSFNQFDQWKDFEKILSMTNLIVTTRPGNSLPFSIDEIPEGLRPHIEIFDRHYTELKSGRNIQFVKITDVNVSASDLRKKIRNDLKVDKYLSYQVEEYIKTNKIYAPLGSKIPDFEAFTKFCAKSLLEKKVINLRAFDLQDRNYISDFAIVASGSNTRQTAALAEKLMQDVKEEFGVYPIGSEGLGEGRWVLVDYGALIVHIFYDFVRNEYQLESLWPQAKEFKFEQN